MKNHSGLLIQETHKVSKYHKNKHGFWVPCHATQKPCLLETTNMSSKQILYTNYETSVHKEIVADLIPRKSSMREYYEATDKKHFGDKSEPGSKFTNPKITCLEDIVELALQQRGNLEGNDTDIFISLGVSPTAFHEDNRYLFVKTEGTVGIKHSDSLHDNTLVQIVRTKPGVPCSVILDVVEQEKTHHGIIILSKDTKGVNDGKDILITAFPGSPTPIIKRDIFEEYENQILTIKKVRELAGDLWLNTRVVS